MPAWIIAPLSPLAVRYSRKQLKDGLQSLLIASRLSLADDKCWCFWYGPFGKISFE